MTGNEFKRNLPKPEGSTFLSQKKINRRVDGFAYIVLSVSIYSPISLIIIVVIIIIIIIIITIIIIVIYLLNICKLAHSNCKKFHCVLHLSFIIVNDS